MDASNSRQEISQIGVKKPPKSSKRSVSKSKANKTQTIGKTTPGGTAAGPKPRSGPLTSSQETSLLTNIRSDKPLILPYMDKTIPISERDESLPR